MTTLFDAFEEYSEAEAKVGTGGLGYDQRIRISKGESVKVMFLGDIDDLEKNCPYMIWSDFNTKMDGNPKRTLGFLCHDINQLKTKQIDQNNPDVGLILRNYGGTNWEKVFRKPNSKFIMLVYPVGKDGTVNETLHYLDCPKTMMRQILDVYKAESDAAKRYQGNSTAVPLSGMVMEITANPAGNAFKVSFVEQMEVKGEIEYSVPENLSFLCSSPSTNAAVVEMLKENFTSVYEDYENGLKRFMTELEEKNKPETQKVSEEPEKL